MKHHIIKLVSFGALLLVTSCYSTKYLSIDVLQPAHISYADNIVNVGIVDNAGASIEDNEADVSIDATDLIKSKSKEVFLNSLAQFMNEEKYFNDVKLYSHTIRTDKAYGQQVPLSKATIQQIAEQMDVDALIVLNTFDVESGERLMSFDGFVFRTKMVNSSLMFRLHDAKGEALTPHMATADSLTWYEDRQTNAPMDIYQQLALQLAESTTKNLLPYWETQERIYYTDGTKLMKAADELVKKGDWKNAAKTWGAAFDAQEKNKQKAKTAANIALANENLGDITNAVEWIRIASNMLEGDKNSDEAIYINWYKVKLLEREQNNPKVLNQMGLEEVKEE